MTFFPKASRSFNAWAVHTAEDAVWADWPEDGDEDEFTWEVNAYVHKTLANKITLNRIVCPDCHGEGHNSAHLGDVTDWLREDPDAIEDYMAGHYDQVCPTCEGRCVLDEPIAEGSDPALWASWIRWCRDDYEYRAMVEAERRMGA